MKSQGVDLIPASTLQASACRRWKCWIRPGIWTRRPRPFAADLRIRAWVAPLDEYSFPSGHTLHAVSFSVVALAYYPWLAPLLLPFTAGVALSRVVLGLHYPSDVLAATGIALLLGGASLQLMPLPF